MKEVASLRYGVIFKKAFSNPAIFKAFVKDFLDIELEIDKVETEKSFSPSIGSVDSRFDLFAEDKKHRTIVDIQHVRSPDHYERFLHYHCAALLEQVVSSKDYRPDLKVFTIVVLTSGDKHQVDMSHVDFDLKDRYDRPLGEIPHKILYLCSKYVSDDTPEPYREWLRAINDSLDEKVEETDYHLPAIQDIFKLIQKDQTTPQEYARMKDEYSTELVLAEEYDKGEKKGRKEEALSIARKMKQKGIKPEMIVEMTGLSEMEIEKC
ncbi:PD-(D/E)XK nuclease family transposase [Candidatus Venteria ishoeyi]|uniref:PD-(D/E)XK nuclease family transposase n=1 Tax=Candidatus Venteria ishoeyi TaxID=1899563 RepID=A0A1H6FGR6_9GAMM|nr:PD-(D/E)XK nuclease family transposase [Candidatus Venteria ishoeyi]SEH08194.1 PD-(D/E)XK nuclease family transposase [Candidatus Venteria ishoeyi]